MVYVVVGIFLFLKGIYGSIKHLSDVPMFSSNRPEFLYFIPSFVHVSCNLKFIITRVCEILVFIRHMGSRTSEHESSSVKTSVHRDLLISSTKFP